MTDLTIDSDRFASSISDMLGDVEASIEKKIPLASVKAGKTGRKEVSKNARNMFEGTGRYAKSWGFKANKKGKESYVEIGSTIPGLPHLLEKGHATLGGGRVEGREHIAPAADVTFDVFQQEVEDLVDEALK